MELQQSNKQLEQDIEVFREQYNNLYEAFIKLSDQEG